MATVWETSKEQFHRRYICGNNTSEISWYITITRKYKHGNLSDYCI